MQVIVGRERPGDVVVGFKGVFGIVLGSKEINGVIPIRLVEADDVGACGIRAVLQVERVFCASDFDVLAHQASNHLSDTSGIALVLGNEEGRGRFV